jgi:hypothetical protein
MVFMRACRTCGRTGMVRGSRRAPGADLHCPLARQRRGVRFARPQRHRSPGHVAPTFLLWPRPDISTGPLSRREGLRSPGSRLGERGLRCSGRSPQPEVRGLSGPLKKTIDTEARGAGWKQSSVCAAFRSSYADLQERVAMGAFGESPRSKRGASRSLPRRVRGSAAGSPSEAHRHAHAKKPPAHRDGPQIGPRDEL